ncbi:hypothetical protein LINGRAHAP2_LOCUS26258 [Linum grandiflorum]
MATRVHLHHRHQDSGCHCTIQGSRRKTMREWLNGELSACSRNMVCLLLEMFMRRGSLQWELFFGLLMNELFSQKMINLLLSPFSRWHLHNNHELAELCA